MRTEFDHGTIDDHLNRQTGETWHDASNNVTGTESFGYDRQGRLTSAANTVGASSSVAAYSYSMRSAASPKRSTPTTT